VAAGAFGFLIFSHVFDGSDLYGASSFFETIPPSSTQGREQGRTLSTYVLWLIHHDDVEKSARKRKPPL
jgi:hypothetical protein